MACEARREDASPLFVKYQCNRCHDGLAVAPAPHDKHCVVCHQEIRDGRFVAAAEDLERWRGHIRSLIEVPSLAGAGRLRREWVASFLLAPHDLRPGLRAMMPRLAVTPEEAKLIARHLVPEEKSTPARGDAARGEALFRSLACGGCHRFSGAGVDAPVEPTTPERMLAPDLRFARDRVQPGALAAWIRDPAGSRMPKIAMSADDAAALAAFVTTTPLAPVAATPIPARLPVLERPVGWDEVAARVFRRLCWHCHSQPDYARGDGGPGNSGGFGFAARGLDLSTANGIASGSFGDDGKRRSVFQPMSDRDPTPRLVAHLLARQVEEAGGTVPGVRGMPLGLPSIPPEDIQLVESWIAQGRPRVVDTLRRETADDHPMQYWVSLPSGWSKDKTWPILVVVEAAEKQFEANARRFVEARGDLPFIIVAPINVTNGRAGQRDPAIYPYDAATWDAIDRDGPCAFDLVGLPHVLDKVRRAYHGEERVYVTGFEAGAHLVWALALRQPERLRAAAPVAGNYIGRCLEDGKIASDAAVPIRGFVGSEDTGSKLYPQWLEARKLAEAHGFKAISESVVPGKGHLPMPDEVIAWFDALRRTP